MQTSTLIFRSPAIDRSWSIVCNLLALSLGIVCGCDSKNALRASVEGRITYKSEPVTAGNVVLENAARGWLRVAALDEKGSFHFDDVNFGAYALSVQPPDPKLPDETSGIQNPVEIAPGMIPDPKNIPHQFRTSQSTPLRITVTNGENRFDFDLASDS